MIVFSQDSQPSKNIKRALQKEKQITLLTSYETHKNPSSLLQTATKEMFTIAR